MMHNGNMAQLPHTHPQKCPCSTTTARISFFILTIRFTVWVVWLNTWRLHLPRRQIQSLKNRKGEGGAGGNCSIGPALLNLKSSGHRKNKHWPCQVKIVLGTSDSSNKGLEPWGSRRRGKVHTFSNSFAKIIQNSICGKHAKPMKKSHERGSKYSANRGIETYICI